MGLIPNEIKVGGTTIKIEMVDKLPYNQLGTCTLSEGVIRIADAFCVDNNFVLQSESCKYNTFLHECVHAILGTMGEFELNNNEKFICTFSSFLCEILNSYGNK